MTVILRNARLIDGKGDTLDHGFVVIEGIRIGNVGKGSGPGRKTTGADEEIDLDGRTLLPGMIDCHVHLCLDGGADPMQSMQEDPAPLLTLKTARAAHLTLLAGVTTVSDLGGKNRIDIADQKCNQHGNCTGAADLVQRLGHLHDRRTRMTFWSRRDGEDGVRQAVREQLKAGADLIKLVATGGVMTPGMDPGAAQFTYEELRAGVEEAHKAGRRTASHAHGNQGIKNALKAGIDSIEHGVFLDVAAVMKGGTFFRKII